MKSSILKTARMAAMLFLMLGVASSAWATGYFGGVPWQVNDVIICFGSGTCNVVRINGNTATLLDQFSDTQLGDTRGVAISNTLHAVVTDNAGSSGSNVVVYTIASVDPTTSPSTPIAHTPVAAPFNGSGGTNSDNAQAVVVNSIGHIFVGNAGSGGISAAPSIVELNPNGSLASSTLPNNPYTLPSNCTDVKGQLLSMDLSKDGLSLYLTSNSGSYSSTSNGGNIKKLTLSTGTCAPFASFGPGVALNGIQDVPAGALPTGGSTSCKDGPCPTDETILVVAEGFFDGDGDPAVEPPIPDQADDINICTNALNMPLVSCALLLDTGGPGLTASPWVANNAYNTGDTVLDANLHVQKVTSPNGTSGGGTPAWSTNGGTTPDGTLTWTDQGTSVVARYPVTGTSALQALTLDPLVRDCSGVTCSTPSPTVNKFWVGDSQSANFYKVDFATGTPSAAFNANADCSSHPDCNATFASVHGLRIFGAQGANQADLTKLFSGALTLSSGNNPPVYAQAVSFPPGASSFDLNTMNAGVYGLIAETPPKATFYASLASQAGPPSNGNNSGATDGGVSCQPTVPSAAGSCIVWKLDVLTNAGNPLPLTSYVSTNFGAPAGTTDFGTHVFLDEHYDVTTFLGNLDPGGGGRISVWSLQEVPADFSTSGTPSGCAFSSPVNNTCYKTNRTTLPFTVPKCSGLSQTQFQSLPQTLLLSLVGVGSGTPKPPPNIIKLTATNTKGPFRYDSLKNQLQFNWTVNGNATAVPGTYRGCALDSPGTKGFTIEGFCVNFTLSNSCK